MTNTFAANGQTWATDEETIKLLRQYRDDRNEKMLALVFTVGQDFGRITKVSDGCEYCEFTGEVTRINYQTHTRETSACPRCNRKVRA